jgi:hypothetical protein
MSESSCAARFNLRCRRGLQIAGRFAQGSSFHHVLQRYNLLVYYFLKYDLASMSCLASGFLVGLIPTLALLAPVVDGLVLLWQIAYQP